VEDAAVPRRSKSYTTLLEARGVPRILWKYSGERGIGLLTGLAIKVTRPNEFNDPFEFTPGIGRAIGVRAVREAYRSGLAAKLDWPTLEEIEGKDDDETVSFIAAEFNRVAKAVLDDRLDAISKDYGVICLSADPRNIGMWSHYAQNHRGFVVGLDHSRVARMPLLPVEYSDRRVLFNAMTIMKTGAGTNVRAHELLLRKSPDWAHEREYRMIWPLAKLLKREVGGQDWYMLPLLPAMIAEIVLGVRASDEFTDEMRKVAAALGGIRLRKAYMHPRKYEIQFMDI
jgi:hypothetical protein